MGMNIHFYSHGACREVTGSKHFLEVGNHTLQIDAGMFQGHRQQAYEKNRDLPFNPADVDSIILTHGHFDHSGALPIMVKNGFKGPIYATSATRDITNIILFDSAYIQQKDFEYLQEKAQKYPERDLIAYEPLYDSQDAVNAMQHFAGYGYHRTFEAIPGVQAALYDAGHILGAATVHLEIENGMCIGFSGDLGRPHLPIIRDPEILPPIDYLVLEGTYGDRLHESIGMARESLEKVIRRATERRGKVIIPAFTIERTQELIYFIHQLTRERRIRSIPIFVDSPMAVNATSIFKIHPECFDRETVDYFLSKNIDPFGFETIRYVTSVRESRDINDLEGPAVIISASGMAENGRILHHLKNHIGNPRNIVAIVGFMAENTLGRKLVERHPSVKIFGKDYPVKAEIVNLDAFSAHADYQEILEWLGKHDLDRLKKVFLVHGEPDALGSLRQKLLDTGIPDVEIVESGVRYPLPAPLS